MTLRGFYPYGSALTRPVTHPSKTVRFLVAPGKCTTPSVGEALSLPLARSALGSLSEGAAEQSEAEGVYFVE